MKCSTCRAYFPMRGRAVAGADDIEISDVPFRAAEPLNGPGEGGSGPTQAMGDIVRPRAASPPRPGACPLCGSSSVRPATPGPLESVVSRLNTRDLYRCLYCNASFRKLNAFKLAAMAAVLLAVLSTATYLAVSSFGGGRRAPQPATLRNKPLPATSPPVFR